METKEKETELVQLIRQLKDYVILERKDASIKLLEQQLARQEDWVNYWKNKYEKCLEELKKETTRWWRF